MQKFSEAVARNSLWVHMHKITRREIKKNAGLCLGAVIDPKLVGGSNTGTNEEDTRKTNAYAGMGKRNKKCTEWVVCESPKERMSFRRSTREEQVDQKRTLTKNKTERSHF